MHAAHVLGIVAGLGPAYVPIALVPGFDTVIAALLGRMEVEEDGLALSSVAFALGRLLGHDARVRGALRQLLGRTAADEAVRVRRHWRWWQLNRSAALLIRAAIV